MFSASSLEETEFLLSLSAFSKEQQDCDGLVSYRQIFMNSPISQGIILSNHYRIVRLLGQGGFGRTYLAEDTHRFNEPCVLKEFAPQTQNIAALNKSQELFEREAGVLYQLKHPQIPRFLELLRVNLDGKEYLFLVQEYVAGQTFRAILENRRQQGKFFSELEVIQLLKQLLPVLEYIHSLGVIHRDISPDNLILRHSDGLPVLIDFGGVKQIAVTIASEYAAASKGATPQPATRLGKVGYAPDEQMRMGVAYPHSDLYALAATIFVLLTGQEPHQLIDPQILTWNWRPVVKLSPLLGSVLDKMLAYRLQDRYQTAREVLQALKIDASGVVVNKGNTTPVTTTQLPLELASSQPAAIHPAAIHRLPSAGAAGKKSSFFTTVLLFVVVMASMAGVGWMAGNYWLKQHNSWGKTLETLSEKERKAVLDDRRQQLGIDNSFYVSLVDEVFYTRYSDLQGRTLTGDAADAIWRLRWDQIADALLQHLSKLSDEARQKLGTYNRSDLARWKQEVNELNLSSLALNDLTDGKFFNLFPEQPRNENFIHLPVGQVWQGIAADQVKALQKGKTLEEIKFDSQKTQKILTHKLKPGEGRAYIAQLQKGQTLKLELQADPPGTLLSIYTPGNTQPSYPLLADSTEVNWSGKLEDSGYYEVVIVSDTPESISYQLKITVK